jgi:hypothetical protein
MKTRILLPFAVLYFGQSCLAELLHLAGTVPDRGAVLSTTRLEPVKATEMKIFVREMDTSKWRRVIQPETLNLSSNIRVQAP